MIKYLGWGQVVLKKKELKPKQRMCLLAGGSGITPMYSIALASSLAKDGVEIWFLFSNKTQDDILIKEELDKLAAMNDKFHLFYTLTRHDERKHNDWNGLKGRVTWDMLKECGFPT
jgi:NAD(P)H-flavin reductase